MEERKFKLGRGRAAEAAMRRYNEFCPDSVGIPGNLMLNISLRPHRSSLKAGSTLDQKVFVMLKVIPNAEMARSRSPIALALVMDTSTSMSAFADQEAAKAQIARQNLRGHQAKQDGGLYQTFHLQLPMLSDLAINAAHMLVDDARLQPDDLISVIHFDDRADVLLPLTPLSRKSLAHEAIESLRTFEGGTRMARGLCCAMDELGSVAPEIAKRALVFTDGAASDEQECDALLPRFGNSNTPIIAVGFGAEYRSELLERMADATQGRPYHLKQVSDLSIVLQDEIGQTAKEVVTDLKMGVSLVNGVRLDSVTKLFPSLSEVNMEMRPYRLGNVLAGDYTVFLLELTVSGVERPEKRVRLGQVNLMAAAPGTGQVQEFPPRELVVSFTHEASALAQIDDEVMGYAQQKSVRRLVAEAMRDAPVDASRARQHLETAHVMTQKLGNGPMSELLQTSLDELLQTGTISPDTGKTVALGLRTRTMKTSAVDDGAMGGLTPEEIRRLSGT